MSDNPIDHSADNGFVSSETAPADQPLVDPSANGPEKPVDPPPPPPPSDLEKRWAHFEALASDVMAIANHIGNVLPSAAPLMRLADDIKARLAQFKELIAEQQK